MDKAQCSKCKYGEMTVVGGFCKARKKTYRIAPHEWEKVAPCKFYQPKENEQ